MLRIVRSVIHPLLSVLFQALYGFVVYIELRSSLKVCIVGTALFGTSTT